MGGRCFHVRLARPKPVLFGLFVLAIHVFAWGNSYVIRRREERGIDFPTQHGQTVELVCRHHPWACIDNCKYDASPSHNTMTHPPPHLITPGRVSTIVSNIFPFGNQYSKLAFNPALLRDHAWLTAARVANYTHRNRHTRAHALRGWFPFLRSAA